MNKSQKKAEYHMNKFAAGLEIQYVTLMTDVEFHTMPCFPGLIMVEKS